MNAVLSSHEWLSHSPDDTFRCGQALGRVLRPPTFVGLQGDLGAGKTQFVRGVAQGAGVPPSEVASPTFAIVYSYEGRGLLLHHADLYRLENEDELYATGFFELLDAQSVALVEWFEKIPGARANDALIVSLEIVGESSRRIVARATGHASAQVLKAWSLEYEKRSE